MPNQYTAKLRCEAGFEFIFFFVVEKPKPYFTVLLYCMMVRMYTPTKNHAMLHIDVGYIVVNNCNT